MTSHPANTLSGDELSQIRDAVPSLDLLAIRSLRRAGFQIVRDIQAEPSGERGAEIAWNRDAASPAA